MTTTPASKKGRKPNVKLGTPPEQPPDFLPVATLAALAEGPAVPAEGPVEANPDPVPQDATQANVGEANADPSPTPTDDTKQAAVTELVRKYGTKDIRAWGGFHAALKEFGLEPKDVTDERLSAASLALHRADEQMHNGIHKFNGTNDTTTTHEEDTTMAKKKPVKPHEPEAPTPTAQVERPAASGEAPKAKGKKAAKPAAKAEAGKMSLKDAAVEVLRQAKQPLSAKELVAAAIEKGLWTPGEGKTPEATLAAAIYTEINKKGSAARFQKAEAGKFALREQQ
jgi:hypothetical protein